MVRRFILVAGLVCVALLATLVWRLGPALTLSLSLAAPASEAWLGHILVQPVREEITIATDSGWLRADLYRPARPRGMLLLVHGLSPAGRRQPDLARLAHLLGQEGLVVVVPQFEGLAAFRLTGKEVDQVRAALRYVVTLERSAGIAGFSFGAGPALLAAADLPGRRVVASFGGYADLRHVIAFITTGAHGFDGHHYVQRQEEYNRWKLLALLVGFVQHQHDARVLEDIVQRKLVNPGVDIRQAEQGLGPEGRAVLALVLNRREDAIGRLLARLPPGAHEALSRLSPLPAIPRIQGRLLIAHGRADDSIPFTESLRLAASAGGHAHIALFETFHHTGPQAVSPSLRRRAHDAWRLIRLADELAPW
jgi:alpha/beta superfamily hydrolase